MEKTESGAEAAGSNVESEASVDTENGKTQATRKGPKNIVLCSDGTGNRGGKARGTNVWAVFNAVWRQPDASGRCPPKTQVTFYDDGVGTQKFFVFKILGGAFGWGYSRNIRDLYRALVSVYEPGDSIYLFGFSRGAYTVRGLAGLVLTQGILNRHEFETSTALERAVCTVFQSYRNRYKSIVGMIRSRLWPKTDRSYKKLKANGQIHDLNRAKEPETSLRFIGVWDTVDAVGLPFDWMTYVLNFFVRFRFPDRELNKRVTKACHAISIDDERATFWPVMWDESDDHDTGRIEQVWFPGVHSNVGGGYPKDQMAMVALDWMMEKAEKEDLWFYKDVRAEVRQAADPHGRIYDSRAGLAAYYRYRPRNLAKICNDRCAKVKIQEPKLHVSTLRRAARATADYAPPNIPAHVAVVKTHRDDGPCVKKMETHLQNTAGSRASGCRTANRFVLFRRILYYVFVAYSLGILAAAAWFYCSSRSICVGPEAEMPKLVGYLFDVIEWLLPDYALSFFNPLLEQAKAHWIIAIAVLAVLPCLAILKRILEGRSRATALDAWREFREEVFPPV